MLRRSLASFKSRGSSSHSADLSHLRHPKVPTRQRKEAICQESTDPASLPGRYRDETTVASCAPLNGFVEMRDSYPDDRDDQLEVMQVPQPRSMARGRSARHAPSEPSLVTPQVSAGRAARLRTRAAGNDFQFSTTAGICRLQRGKRESRGRACSQWQPRSLRGERRTPATRPQDSTSSRRCPVSSFSDVAQFFAARRRDLMLDAEPTVQKVGRPSHLKASRTRTDENIRDAGRVWRPGPGRPNAVSGRHAGRSSARVRNTVRKARVARRDRGRLVPWAGTVTSFAEAP